MKIDRDVAVIGLGYVGLPLAVEFGKKYKTIGFDINQKRINELRDGIDITLESNSDDIKSAKYLKFTCDINDLKEYNIYIVTVPTPINHFKSPDLAPLLAASEMIGSSLLPLSLSFSLGDSETGRGLEWFRC